MLVEDIFAPPFVQMSDLASQGRRLLFTALLVEQRPYQKAAQIDAKTSNSIKLFKYNDLNGQGNREIPRDKRKFGDQIRQVIDFDYKVETNGGSRQESTEDERVIVIRF